MLIKTICPEPEKLFATMESIIHFKNGQKTFQCCRVERVFYRINFYPFVFLVKLSI